MRDGPLVVVTILWIAAAAVLVMSFDLEHVDTVSGGPIDCTTEAGAPNRPADIHFGLDLAGPGILDATVSRVPPDGRVIWLACLEPELAVNEVELEVIRLLSNGDSEVVLQREPVPNDPRRPWIGGEIPPSAVTQWGRGTYLFQAYGDATHPVARGNMQIATNVPEYVEAFRAYTPATLLPGEHVGYQFQENGQVLETHTASLSEAVDTQVIRRATYDGITYLLVVEGIWERFWLPEDEAVVLSSP